MASPQASNWHIHLGRWPEEGWAHRLIVGLTAANAAGARVARLESGT